MFHNYYVNIYATLQFKNKIIGNFPAPECTGDNIGYFPTQRCSSLYYLCLEGDTTPGYEVSIKRFSHVKTI